MTTTNTAIIAGLVAILSLLSIVQIAQIHHAFALKNFFNCMTDIANKNHKLTIDDVNSCYAKEFHNPPK